MATKPSCPYCGSFTLKLWSFDKNKCGRCQKVFKRTEAVLKEYVPEKKRPTRRISDAQERVTARCVGGRRTKSSGSTPNKKEKGDVKSEDLRVECKSTGKKSYSLKLEDLMKLAGQARGDEIPVFSVEFRGEVNKRFYIMDEGWFLQLLEAHRRDSDDP